MGPKKYDSFQPKHATNIDGFFVRPAADRPRQPVFRPQPAKPQAPSGMLAEMPRRVTEQPLLVSASQAAAVPEVGIPFDNTGHSGRRRDRRRAAAAEAPEKKRKRISWKKLTKRTGLILGILILAGGFFFGFKFYKDIAKLTGNKNPLSLLSAFRPAHLDNQDGRVNILVAGNSVDDAGHAGAALTDSIMVLSVNTRDNTALIVSVPRDLWVDIPGVGHSKINAAYTNGGMDQLKSVIETNLGIPINYDVLVNYGAFKDLVNAVGGIAITIKSPDPRGIYDPSLDYTSRNCCALAKYPNGPVTLNGTQALNLARARGDTYGSYGFPMSDFDRTEHQRQMLIAIKDKASSSSVIANPLKVSSLVDAVGKNVKTDLQLNEIETLYSYMKKVNDNQIASYNINTLKGTGTTLLANYTSPNGESALIPAAGLDDFSDIQTQLLRVLSSNPLVKESASVIVLNGTDTVGLAKKQANILAPEGINVLGEADAPANQPTTTIIDNSGGSDPNTLIAIKKQYNATVVTNAKLVTAYPNANFIVILGASASPATSSSSSTN